MKKFNVLLVLSLVIVGCAKEKKYKKIYKDQNVIAKDLLSTDVDDPYIYVPTVENSPMNVTSVRPYWSGEQKLVTLRFTEKSLEVLELPTEDKFEGNIGNFSPVIALEIEHKGFRCKKDQYNECSNVEEEIDNQHWSKKKYIEADFTKLAVREVNLPEQIDNLFGECLKEKGKVLRNLEITEDAINITIEKTLDAGIECADVQTFDDLRNLSFKVNYHYSFVKRSKLASSGYQGIIYPNKHQNNFGFFTTTVKKLNADNVLTDDSDKVFLNRWNPDRKEIVYNLNSAFFKPQNKRILDATHEAMETINNSFARAGVDLKIKLENGSNKLAGDLRNSFIVMVEDPLSSGVIGYGPSIADPKTGEIVKAQTIMYYGSIIQGVKRAYEEIVEESRRSTEASNSAAAVIAEDIKNGKKINFEEDVLKSQSFTQAKLARRLNIVQGHEDVRNLTHGNPISVKDIRNLSRNKLFVRENPNYKSVNEIAAMMLKKKKEIDNLSSEAEILETYSELEELKQELYSRECYYQDSNLDVKTAVLNGLNLSARDLARDPSKLKPWLELSEEDKQNLIDKIAPAIWISTLVHEVGHNLGLRHNFAGSEDKDNFFSREEQRAMGMKRAPVFASIMDYAPSTINELPVFGHYDVAALRFAYKRQLITKDGKVVSLGDSITHEGKKFVLAEPKSMKEFEGETKEQKDAETEVLRGFEYCTDEHTSVNAGCNRHDEGVGYTAMANYYIEQYKKNYERRNIRNKRNDFSGTTDLDYYMRVRYTFEGLRIFFETFDRVNGIYKAQLAADPTLWDTIDFLRDLKQATKISADFYLKVLKTPTVHCLVKNLKTGRMFPPTPIEDIAKDQTSCFNLELSDTVKVVGETGLFTDNVRGNDIRSDVKPDPSQISIRGIWLDKYLAVDYLTKRDMRISTFDDFRGNFFDYAEFRGPIEKVFTDMISGKIESYPEVRLADGSKVTLDDVLPRSPEEAGKPFAFDIGNTTMITRTFDWRVRGLFHTPEVDLRELLVEKMKVRLNYREGQLSSLGFWNNLSVIRLTPESDITEEIAAQTEFKDKTGSPIARFAALRSNKLAIDMIKEREFRLVLDALDEEKLTQIAIARMQGQERTCKVEPTPPVVVVPPVTTPTDPTTTPPTTTTDPEPVPQPEPIPAEYCIAWEGDLDKIVAFLRGEMPADEDLIKILDIMK